MLHFFLVDCVKVIGYFVNKNRENLVSVISEVGLGTDLFCVCVTETERTYNGIFLKVRHLRSGTKVSVG